MAALEVTKKLHIYHTLYRLNRSFSAIVTHCQKLQEAGALEAKLVRRFQGFTQEIQSEINETLLETMHELELDDYNRFGKIRIAREKELRGSQDILIRPGVPKRQKKKQK